MHFTAYVENCIHTLKDLTGLKMHIKVDTGMNRLGVKTIDDFEREFYYLIEQGNKYFNKTKTTKVFSVIFFK